MQLLSTQHLIKIWLFIQLVVKQERNSKSTKKIEYQK